MEPLRYARKIFEGRGLFLLMTAQAEIAALSGIRIARPPVMVFPRPREGSADVTKALSNYHAVLANDPPIPICRPTAAAGSHASNSRAPSGRSEPLRALRTLTTRRNSAVHASGSASLLRRSLTQHVRGEERKVPTSVTTATLAGRISR